MESRNPTPVADIGARLSAHEQRLRLLLCHLAGRAVRARVEDTAGETYDFEVFDVRLDNVVAEITSPAAGPSSEVVLPIEGSARVRAGSFVNYTLEWSSIDDPATWNLIENSVSPVTDGTLGVWDRTGLPTGEYTVRLVVDGTTQDSTTVKVTLDRELVSGWQCNAALATIRIAPPSGGNLRK